MIELERNRPVDFVALCEFFTRCGWKDPEAVAKLQWALAASEEWVVCRLNGQIIGFGRSCRLNLVKRIVFDLVVDPRFAGGALSAEIVRLLAENVSGLEEMSIFNNRGAAFPVPSRAMAKDPGSAGVPRTWPWASPEVYLGKQTKTSEGEK